MRIEELSVGDWVRYRDREWIVCSLYQFTEEVGLWRKDSQLCEYVADIEPIPLTSEILEKNGFVRNGKYKEWNNTKNWDETPFIGISLDRQSLRVKNFGRDIFIEDKVICVHELQRSLRLAWADKKIEL